MYPWFGSMSSWFYATSGGSTALISISSVKKHGSPFHSALKGRSLGLHGIDFTTVRLSVSAMQRRMECNRLHLVGTGHVLQSNTNKTTSLKVVYIHRDIAKTYLCKTTAIFAFDEHMLLLIIQSFPIPLSNPWSTPTYVNFCLMKNDRRCDSCHAQVMLRTTI